MKGWGAMKWTRKMLVEKYGEELMALAMTKGGLSKREVYVMPVKELDLQVGRIDHHDPDPEPEPHCSGGE